ncbi:phosphoglycerate mutase family protein [uncultured Desulfobacter sp.]|uniref:phosphoglycerate mutase family protein n=1 Tax=uncultured Desulfobacter sp. TaxID=240139 RepID=UPI0029F4F5E4|nr:phosphoglycerate mutase family protein [uncultured Desulfobacter sp.]
MTTIIEIAESMQQDAWKVINDTNIIQIWSSIGATINLVGSLKMGLLVNNRDIDFHIYTTPFKLSDSFSAMAKLAENRFIKTISYNNLLGAEDKCIEWHAFYEDKDGHSWQIDMIHILNESVYAGHFEKVAERISAVLTPEIRANILQIKNSIPIEKKVMGIQVYKAVIEHGIKDIDSFWQWREQNPDEGIITWIP